MSSAEYSYENFAVVIVLSGCGAAAIFACLVLICCHLFLKKKESRIRSRYYNASQSGFERQTTSDENGDFFSYCFEESSLPQMTSDVEYNTDTQRPSIAKCELNANKNDDNESLTANERIRCSSMKNKTRKASLPSRITTIASEEKKVNRFSRQRRASISHGIVRQESFDVPEEEHDMDTGEALNAETGDSEEMDEKSPETMRKQYRELWQLRATFEAEESIAGESEVNTKTDARLSKNDSGYKSIERKDYSIDLKTETIFRQFTSTSLSQKSPHQSIQEENEQENEVQATYV